MKRTVCLALAMSMVMGTTAFAAEQKVTFMRESEVALQNPQNPPIKKDGKWMVSLEDLERLTGTQATEGKDLITFHKSVVLTGAELGKDAAAYFRKDGTLLEGVNGSYRKMDATEFREGDILYLPCRDYAEAIGYEVQWFLLDGDCILLRGQKEMPEVTLNVEYDANRNEVQGRIQNEESQSFLYGAEFTIERKTENGWERVKKAELGDIDDYGLTMSAKRAGEDGITDISYQMRTKLTAGEYRIGIPFSYTYFLKGNRVNYISQKVKENSLGDRDWDIYYSTKWGKPDFYFDGAGIFDDGFKSTTELKRTTKYTLYSTFTVE